MLRVSILLTTAPEMVARRCSRNGKFTNLTCVLQLSGASSRAKHLSMPDVYKVKQQIATFANSATQPYVRWALR